MIMAYLISNPQFNIWNISYITSKQKIMKRTNPVERCIQYVLSLKNALKMETLLLEIKKLHDPCRIQKVNNNNNNNNNNNRTLFNEGEAHWLRWMRSWYKVEYEEAKCAPLTKTQTYHLNTHTTYYKSNLGKAVTSLQPDFVKTFTLVDHINKSLSGRRCGKFFQGLDGLQRRCSFFLQGTPRCLRNSLWKTRPSSVVSAFVDFSFVGVGLKSQSYHTVDFHSIVLESRFVSSQLVSSWKLGLSTPLLSLDWFITNATPNGLYLTPELFALLKTNTMHTKIAETTSPQSVRWHLSRA